MVVATAIPVAEYLSTTYHPDCDYVDGQLQERNAGEMDHGDVQASCVVYVRTKCTGFWAVTEVRVQLRPDRFRIPDVSIVRGGKPKTRIFTTPPLVAVEILSPEDRASRLQERIDDYLAFGIPAIWVIDPETRRGFIYTSEGMREAKDGILRSHDGSLEVPLRSLFED